MTDILRPPQEVDSALFVVRALTEENIAQELRDMYGDAAFEGTVENALACKSEALVNKHSAPRSYEELMAAQKEYDDYLAGMSPAERAALAQRKKEAGTESDAVMSIPLVPDKEQVVNEATLTPEQYAGLPMPPRKEKIRANPVKELWDEPEKDLAKHPREFTPEGTAMILKAAREKAIHPRLAGEDLQALDFLAEHSDDADGRVSRFILETARNKRRTRAFLTNVLLRVAA